MSRVFCKACNSVVPGDSEADLFKHNLTWEHRSKLDASQLSTKKSPASSSAKADSTSGDSAQPRMPQPPGRVMAHQPPPLLPLPYMEPPPLLLFPPGEEGFSPHSPPPLPPPPPFRGVFPGWPPPSRLGFPFRPPWATIPPFQHRYKQLEPPFHQGFHPPPQTLPNSSTQHSTSSRATSAMPFHTGTQVAPSVSDTQVTILVSDPCVSVSASDSQFPTSMADSKTPTLMAGSKIPTSISDSKIPTSVSNSHVSTTKDTPADPGTTVASTPAAVSPPTTPTNAVCTSSNNSHPNLNKAVKALNGGVEGYVNSKTKISTSAAPSVGSKGISKRVESETNASTSQNTLPEGLSKAVTKRIPNLVEKKMNKAEFKASRIGMPIISTQRPRASSVESTASGTSSQSSQSAVSNEKEQCNSLSDVGCKFNKTTEQNSQRHQNHTGGVTPTVSVRQPPKSASNPTETLSYSSAAGKQQQPNSGLNPHGKKLISDQDSRKEKGSKKKGKKKHRRRRPSVKTCLARLQKIMAEDPSPKLIPPDNTIRFLRSLKREQIVECVEIVPIPTQEDSSTGARSNTPIKPMSGPIRARSRSCILDSSDSDAETQPTPRQPAKTQPTPHQPAKVQPTPRQPAKTQPTPHQPAKTQPTPHQPAKVQPTPRQPTKTQPTPHQPAKVHPTPRQPTKTQPTPHQPAKTQPTPHQPAKTQPTSQVLARTHCETQPTPCKPVQTQPTPCKPVQTQPTPCKPAQTQPTPCKPAQTQPAPCKPVQILTTPRESSPNQHKSNPIYITVPPPLQAGSEPHLFGEVEKIKVCFNEICEATPDICEMDCEDRETTLGVVPPSLSANSEETASNSTTQGSVTDGSASRSTTENPPPSAVSAVTCHPSVVDSVKRAGNHPLPKPTVSGATPDQSHKSLPTREDPSTPIKNTNRLKLPLISPKALSCTQQQPLNSATLAPLQPLLQCPLESVNGPTPSPSLSLQTASSTSGILQLLQKKIDVETSKLKLIELQEVPPIPHNAALENPSSPNVTANAARQQPPHVSHENNQRTSKGNMQASTKGTSTGKFDSTPALAANGVLAPENPAGKSSKQTTKGTPTSKFDIDSAPALAANGVLAPGKSSKQTGQKTPATCTKSAKQTLSVSETKIPLLADNSVLPPARKRNRQMNQKTPSSEGDKQCLTRKGSNTESSIDPVPLLAADTALPPENPGNKSCRASQSSSATKSRKQASTELNSAPTPPLAATSVLSPTGKSSKQPNQRSPASQGDIHSPPVSLAATPPESRIKPTSTKTPTSTLPATQTTVQLKNPASRSSSKSTSTYAGLSDKQSATGSSTDDVATQTAAVHSSGNQRHPISKSRSTTKLPVHQSTESNRSSASLSIPTAMQSPLPRQHQQAISRTNSPILDSIINSLKSRRSDGSSEHSSDDVEATTSTFLSGRSEAGSGGETKKRKRKRSAGGQEVKRQKVGKIEPLRRGTDRTTTEPGTPSSDAGTEGVGGSRDSELENMSVSSSQHPSTQSEGGGDEGVVMTQHAKFAASIAELDKRDKELQEKLYEAQREVMGVVQSVKEAENHLAELEQHQRRLTQQRTELTDEYKRILDEKQNLFSLPPKTDVQDSTKVDRLPDLSFFSRMKTLSEKEQDMQLKLLQGNQLLESISMQRTKEKEKLQTMKLEKLDVSQNHLTMLMSEYRDIQRQKQELLMSWNSPTLSGEQPLSENELPLQSTSNDNPLVADVLAPDSSMVSSASTEAPSCDMNTQTPVKTHDKQSEHMLPLDHSAYTHLQFHLHEGSSIGRPVTPPRVTPGGSMSSPPNTMLTPLEHQEQPDAQSSDKPCQSGSSAVPNHMLDTAKQNAKLNWSDTAKDAVIVLKEESVELHQRPSPAQVRVGTSSPGPSTGPVAGCGGDCSDTLRQAWIAAQALTSPPGGPGIRSGCGASRDVPMEIHSGDEEGEGETRELSEGVLEYDPPHTSSVLGIKTSMDSLYTCSSDKSVRVYNTTSHREVKRLCNHRRSVTCVEVFTCGSDTYVVSGSSDKHIIMCDAKTGEIEIDFCLGARVMSMLAQGSLLAAGLSNGYVHLINLQTKCALGKWLVGEDPGGRDISCLGIHQDTLFTACYDNKVTCWDISDYTGGHSAVAINGAGMKKIHQICHFEMLVLCMQVEEGLLYCGSADTTLKVFSTSTWQLHAEIRGHTGAVSGMCVSGNLLITSCFDHFIRCYDTKDMVLLQVYVIPDLPFTLCTAGDTVYCGLRNGKVISIKIDLSHYYQCQWAECGLKFGIKDHLIQHLTKHFPSTGEGPVKCKWDGCNHFVSLIPQHINFHFITSSYM